MLYSEYMRSNLLLTIKHTGFLLIITNFLETTKVVKRFTMNRFDTLGDCDFFFNLFLIEKIKSKRSRLDYCKRHLNAGACV